VFGVSGVELSYGVIVVVVAWLIVNEICNIFIEMCLFTHTRAWQEECVMCRLVFGTILLPNILPKYINRWVQLRTEGTVVVKVCNPNYLGNLVSYEGKDVNVKLQTYNTINGIIIRCFGNCMTTETELTS
jgi:hypothetical protein